jgi:hypothetical protein
LTPRYDTSLDIDKGLPAGGILAGCSSHFRLEWRIDSSDRWRCGDWILLPYVHPVGSDVRTRFRTALLEKLKVDGADPQVFTSALLNYLLASRKQLVSLYANHFEVGQNAISMSLYSGPQGPKKAKRDADREWLRPVGPAQIGYKMVPSPVAWLGTGDSKLKQTLRRQPWMDFFRNYSREIFFSHFLITALSATLTRRYSDLKVSLWRWQQRFAIAIVSRISSRRWRSWRRKGNSIRLSTTVLTTI